MTKLAKMYELSGAELDAVTGGAQGNGLGNAFGLVAAGIGAGVGIDQIRILNNDFNGNTVNVLSNGVQVAVPIGIAASVLGMSANALRTALSQ